MIKKLFCLLLCIGLLFCLCSCTGTENTQTPSSTELPLQENITTTTTQENVIPEAVQITPPTQSETAIKIEETFSETVSPIAPNTPPTTVASETQTTTQEPPQTTKNVEKTGEMAFSDDSSNRYIEAVSSKYGVNANNLVALYTVPENDSNIVLEFDGTKNNDGTLLRNKNTLIAIYSIDKNLNSKRASENRSLNEYSYGEMKVMFISVTTYIMPEFEELK